MALVINSEVRMVNKDLLNTDGISNTDIDNKISEAIITVFSQIGETLDDTLINDGNCPADVKQCIKLIAAADILISHYADMPNILTIADLYTKKAQKTIDSIVAGKRRFSQLQKQKIPMTVGFDFVQDSSDLNVDRFLNKLNNYR